MMLQKIRLAFGIAFIAVASGLFAQDRTPPAANAVASSTEAAAHPLRQILISDNVSAAEKLAPAPALGFVVLPSGMPIDVAEVQKRLAATENQPIDQKLLTTISEMLERIARQHNFPHAVALIPTQSIAEGVVRIALILSPPVIRHIAIGGTPDDAEKAAHSTGSEFVLLSPGLEAAHRVELTKRLAQAQDQVFQPKLVAAIGEVIALYFRQHDFPIATTVIPPQNPADGTLRVVVQMGTIRNIKMAGNRWFSESLLRRDLGIARGAPLRFSALDSAISWTNNNPFRRVRVQVEPVAGSGEADLIIAVQEARPLRVVASYDNSGNDIVGNDHYTAAISYANLWGLDHQISYQFLTSNLGPHTLQSHGVDYRAPLPWRDYVAVSASYVEAQPSIIAGVLTQKGENVGASFRYTHPIRTGTNPAEIYAGIDFKQSNNNLLFSVDPNTQVPVLTNKTDIFQFTAGGSMMRRDKRGAWAFGASVYLSPGSINSLNSNTAFFDTRALAKARYAYGQLTFQRLLNLKRGWDFTSRGVLQVADGNLLPSEQFYVGGGASVRGFHENTFGGDEGFLWTNELLAPAWQRKLPRLPKGQNVLETRLVAFYDAGQVREKHATNLDPKFAPLAGAGFGLRTTLATNFSVSFDYGWQITRLPYLHTDHTRGHIKATLAF